MEASRGQDFELGCSYIMQYPSGFPWFPCGLFPLSGGFYALSDPPRSETHSDASFLGLAFIAAHGRTSQVLRGIKGTLLSGGLVPSTSMYVGRVYSTCLTCF